MMEKDPTRRIKTAAEVAERLEPWCNAESDLVDRPIERQAWTPPPPPHEPSQISAQPELPGTANSGALNESYSDVSLSAPSIPGEWEIDTSVQPRRSVGMSIAITLALTVPISLLVGAIIGFLVRGEL